MSFDKNDLVVALVTLIAGSLLSVVVGLVTDNVAVAILLAIGSILIGIHVDMRINQHDFMVRSQGPLMQSYEHLRHDSCPLFKKVAQDKWEETEIFFKGLQSDVLYVGDVNRVYQLLEFLFCEVGSIKEIYATSYDEMDEWTDVTSWWGANYLHIHERADEAGIKLHRIFILSPDTKEEEVQHVFEENAKRHVNVRLASAHRVAIPDLDIAGNCLIFCDGHGRPLYVLQATHDKNGHFVRAEIYRDATRMSRIASAYLRISYNSTPYVPSGEPGILLQRPVASSSALPLSSGLLKSTVDVGAGSSRESTR